MTTLTLNIPDELAEDKKNTVQFIAAKMYESGKLSLGQAAEMCDLSKNEFAEILSEYGVSYLNYTSDDVLDDARKL